MSAQVDLALSNKDSLCHPGEDWGTGLLMKYKTVLLHAFGTILRIKAGTHPYRQLMREGRRNGRQPRPDDVQVLMTFNGGLAQASDHLGIAIAPSRLSLLEEMFEEEVSSIEASPMPWKLLLCCRSVIAWWRSVAI
ncbi:hypothetical protein ACPCYX_08160 [Pseudomonas fluorescens]|uniref:hypothetical protein n=1 Tax=Pseudomonas fluorescens TaxID=294 RepID=UPI003C205D4D